MIKKIEIFSDGKNPWVMGFGQKNVIHSGGKNSMGKTTVIRSILFGLGFITKLNFVDGTFIKGFRVNLDFECRNSVWRFERNKSNLMITNLDKKKYHLKESFEIKNNEDVKRVVEFIASKVFEVKPVLVSVALFSNYADQQYGIHTINRTNESIFPRNLKFNINNFANEYNENLKEVAMLLQKKTDLNKYKQDLEMIKKNTIKVDSKLSVFDLINSKQTNLRNLERKLSNYKQIEKEFKNKKQILDFFDHNIEQLGLVYRDNEGNFKPLTNNNFKDSTSIQNKFFDVKLKNLENKIDEVKKEIRTSTKNLVINKKTLANFEKTKQIIASLNALKHKINESELKGWEDALKKTTDEISQAQNIINSKMWLQLESDVRQYLQKFANKNKNLTPFIEKMKNAKDLLLKESSKFRTYVGAIRFAIITSFRFAISDFIIKKGWNFPIIIDNLMQEEIDEDMKEVYNEILLSRKEQIIISSLDKPLFIKKWDSEKVVNRDLFKDQSMSLFEAFD